MSIVKSVVWAEKYRPKTVDEAILPSSIKESFRGMVKSRAIPHLILHGGPGIGKTTVARAMLDQIEADVMKVNASSQLGRGIDSTTEIEQFASTKSFGGGRKYVILDEADSLTRAAQRSLRAMMDQFEKNCGFILACNYVTDLIEPLHSRCTKIAFSIGKDEKQALMMAFLTRAESILKAEGTEYELPVVAQVIMKYFPDWRSVLNALQDASYRGKVDTGALARMNTDLEPLIGFLKEQKFTEMRKWVNDNSWLDRRTFFTALFDQLPPKLTLSGAGQAIAYLHKYDSESSHVANFEISMTACLFHLMGILKGEWK